MTVFPTSVMTALVDAPVRYDLAESTCPPVRVDDLVDPAALADIALGYGTSRGDADLRNLIAADTGVGADRVLLTIGGMHAMFLLVQTVCGPGDRMLLPSPYFPPARTIPEALGVPVDVVPLSFDEGYRLPLDRIAAALTPHTRLVSLASPQNPSGIRLTDDEVRAVPTVVADRAPDAVVLVDESFRESTYGAAPAPPSFAPASPRIVTCSSLSKAHGAPGLRIDWLTVTDPDLLGRLREARFQTTSRAPPSTSTSRRRCSGDDRRSCRRARSGCGRRSTSCCAGPGSTGWRWSSRTAAPCVACACPSSGTPTTVWRPSTVASPNATPGSRRALGSARPTACSGLASAICQPTTSAPRWSGSPTGSELVVNLSGPSRARPSQLGITRTSGVNDRPYAHHWFEDIRLRNNVSEENQVWNTTNFGSGSRH
jgi:aspartate/methionine/tyrosine aminotransferase